MKNDQNNSKIELDIASVQDSQKRVSVTLTSLETSLCEYILLNLS